MLAARRRPTAPVRHNRRRALRLLLAFLLPVLALRVDLLARSGRLLAPENLRGLVIDLEISLATCLLVVLIGRGQRWVAAVAAALWCLVQIGSYEHVRALDALPAFVNLRYLGDLTFVTGSLLALSQPLLHASVLLVAVLLAVWRPAPVWSPRLWPFGAALALTLGAALVWPVDFSTAHWRQTNALAAAAREVMTASVPRVVSSGSGAADALYASDLDGAPRLPGRPGTNVLLILLEGVSGAHLPSFAAVHGTPSSLRLPELDALAERGLGFSTFVTHQRQTDRGEYAVLCGDYPTLLSRTSKMALLQESPKRPCLPLRLAAAGYDTVYLQAAPLAFMAKDRFMPLAGFGRVMGNEDFPIAYARNQWGVDDRTFFERAAELIRELEGEESPWFLTLLNVGTHHPFVVPPDLGDEYGEEPLERAMRHLDATVGDFIERLEGLGVRDDTLILITSDESVGAGAPADDLTRALTENWGFLIVLAPEGEPARVDEVFVQSDLALSVLDYLGLAEGSTQLIGRSVFRRYARPRPIVFANVYKHHLGAFFDDLELYVCGEGLEDCAAYLAAPMFTPDRRPDVVLPKRVDLLREMSQRSLGVTSEPRREGSYPLLVERVVPVVEADPRQIVFAGQGFSFPANTEIDVLLDLELRGSGRVLLEHDFAGLGAAYYQPRIPPLEGGDRLVLQYTCRVARQVRGGQVRLWATQLAGDDLELMFHGARLSYEPLPPAWQLDDAWSVREETARIERGDEVLSFSELGTVRR